MNEFISNAVTSLNITIPNEYKNEESAVSDDPNLLIIPALR